MSVSIKVGIRCRPFVCDDKLGVDMQQPEAEGGTVELLNSKYTQNFFSFTWSWWSAYSWQRRCQSDKDRAENMKLINQDAVYESCGQKMKADLLDGNAVVIFAYGLSGSGKTFTVFGPDDPKADVAWFKHAEPHDMWGCFPHMAYDVFEEKKENWKISMKYFQNVVDIIRDLMSPTGTEKIYKTGMKKDKDGFTDVTWCIGAILNSWDDLRNQFQASNARKAIAPTQFNHQSTRGHCIMTLEVEKPHPTMDGMKQKGRVYVCDLAGTEPAGDVVYAKYETVKHSDGSVDHNYLGPHEDAKKTKELQNQGKKINLSLSEMAQFFMKMASAIKKKKLKPGQSIPGCNSYFLCKYLKDTMLQAKTYLFCAIRPEVKYHQYTFSTLGFAKNASVIKLSPKKATAAASPRERKLMQELEEMKKLVESLKANGGGGGGGSGDAGKDKQIADLQAMLAQKQQAMMEELSQGSNSAQNAELERQKQEYGSRGITLKEYATEDDYKSPYLLNIDVDEFRSRRFMYCLKKETTVFGTDIKPMVFGVKPAHASISSDLMLVAGEGETFHNGKLLEGKVKLKHNDRIVMAGEMMLLKVPSNGKGKAEGDDDDDDELSPEQIAKEYNEGKMEVSGTEEMKQMLKMKKQWEAEREKMREQMAQMDVAGQQKMREQMEKEAAQRQEQANRQQMLELIPLVDEANKLLGLLNRPMLKASAMLRVALSEDGSLETPEVKVRVENVQQDDVMYLDPYEFTDCVKVMKNEIGFLVAAYENNQDYESTQDHDPFEMVYSSTYEVGTAMIYLESCAYFLETEADEAMVDIKSVGDSNVQHGQIEVRLTPLPCEDEENPDNLEVPDIEDTKDLIGLPWNYKLEIVGCVNMSMVVDEIRCEYVFNGVHYSTPPLTVQSDHPHISYSQVLHVDKVTPEFVNMLEKTMLAVRVMVSPYSTNPPKDRIATSNPAIAKALGFGGASLREQVDALREENAALKKEIAALKEKLGGGKRGELAAAQAKDESLNG